MKKVEILEVAPRDGFQAVKPFIPTEAKIALIEELAACGFARLEIGSFVSPKAVPQLADTGEVLKRARLPKGLRIHVLVPNARGLEMALEAGLKEVAWVISVSESHNRANVNRSVDDSFKAFEAGAAGGLGGCPFAPGAAGNTATEDLVFAFEHMGVATGIDLAKLLDAADRVAQVAPDQAGGKVRTVPRRRVLSGFGHAAHGVPA